MSANGMATFRGKPGRSVSGAGDRWQRPRLERIEHVEGLPFGITTTCYLDVLERLRALGGVVVVYQHEPTVSAERSMANALQQPERTDDAV